MSAKQTIHMRGHPGQPVYDGALAWCRDHGDLAWCRDHGDLGGDLVEIGSFAGEFAVIASPYFRLVHCIDPWDIERMSGMRQGAAHSGKPDGDCSDYERWFDRRTGGVRNIRKLKGTDDQFFQDFAERQLSGIYIDSIHTENSVLATYSRWVTKVKSGGVVGGHDYGSEYPGVKRAVDHISALLKQPPEIYSDSSWAFGIRR